jgi:hypothetical protein
MDENKYDIIYEKNINLKIGQNRNMGVQIL